MSSPAEVEFSSVFKATLGSFPSTNGAYIASVVAPRLVIRNAAGLDIHRVINLPPKFAGNIKHIKWSPCPTPASSRNAPTWRGYWCKRSSRIEEGCFSPRVLLADDETIHVYDMKDERWTATINQGFGGIKNVEFGKSSDEIIVLSDFQLKASFWNLTTKKLVEIPHPKFTSKGFGYRPITNHFAVLKRLLTHDVVTIHDPATYNVAASFALPTVDAQGLKWSPCGRWIAVWDAASVGYRVLVYTVDGHLYRTFEIPCEGLGVKSVEWSHEGDYLTVGSYDGKLRFLGNVTFSPVITMSHTRTIRLPGFTIWSECATSTGERFYSPVQQPTVLPSLPSNPGDPQPNMGISMMSYSNPDGLLIATKADNSPSTLWIWSVKLLRPFAILVHLSAVKSFSWHPTYPDLLMILCAPEEGVEGGESSGVVYFWCPQWHQPRAVRVPLGKLSGATWAKWVLAPKLPGSNNSSVVSSSPQPYAGPQNRSVSPQEEMDKRPMFLFGDKETSIVGYVEDEVVEDEDPDAEEVDMQDTVNVDWEYFVAVHEAPKRTPSSASQHSLPGGRFRDALGRTSLGDVTETPSAS